MEFLSNSEIIASTVQLAWYAGSKASTWISWDVREGLTSLHVCAWYGLDVAIPRLLDEDSHLDVNCPDENGRTPLIYACRRGHSTTVKLLLELRADPGIKCDRGSSAIVEATMFDHPEIVEILLATKSVDINEAYRYPNHIERTVLMLAALHGKEEIVSCILQKDDVDVKLKDGEDYPAICLAVTTEDVAIVDLLLLQKGINVDSSTGDGATALIIAAQHGHDKVVRSLLQHGANLLLRDCEGGTAISWAMGIGHHSTVKTLLQPKVDFSGKDNHGHSLLHSACLSERTQPDVIRQLINGGVSVGTPDNHGEISLHVACRMGNLEVVEVLLAEGASPEAKDKYDRTPLEVAWQHGEMDVVETLASRTGRSVPDDASRPLWALAKLGHEDLVRAKVQTKRYDLGEIDPDTGKTALHVSQGFFRTS